MSDAIGEVSTTFFSESDFFDGKFGDAIRNIGDDLWLMDESELEKNFSVSEIDFILRKRITEVLDEARKSPETKRIPHTKLYNGICTLQNFYGRVIKNPHRLVWLLKPLRDDDIIKAGYYASVKRAMEIIAMPLDSKSASSILKALEFFANRHLGPVIQRIEQKSMNMNVTRTVMEETMNLDPEIMLEKYAEAKSKISPKLVEASVDDEEEK